ncbi:MAG: N-6 DNA methylase [Thermoanaerobaculia bacterium]|nr:N-6 DNA methylase [Thermoanaerobaculia bacterium]
MIRAGDVSSACASGGPAALFRILGYPIAPVEIDAVQWRRAGIALPWNGTAKLSLMSRLERFDLFLLEGSASGVDINEFMRSYKLHNVLTTSVIVYWYEERISIFSASRHGAARRLDFSTTAPSSHAIDRLNLLTLGDSTSPARLFDRALDREAITREFFLRFRDAVRAVSLALRESCPDETREAVDAEALLILSRLLFLCFIQEKGWLDGERRFLVDRIDRACRDGRDAFTTVLVPLFFGCLNTPTPERDAAARTLGAIPYLNGGLFEPASFERRNPRLQIENELVRRIVEDVFERFDFSADEDDTERTSVDPEMLGKVFESLMAEDERAASGSFYTPKEIVDVLTARAIERLTDGARGDALRQRLESITILDPACGSGAFLLSALHAIERLMIDAGHAPGAALRQQIVERSLYGVDVKPEAVRLCELRLWLAIVSATDASPETVRPLPNLDRNILQGNSLLGPLDFLGTAPADVYREWSYGLRAQQSIVERYRSAPREERPALYRLLRSNDQRLAVDLLARASDADEKELQIATTPRRDLFGDPLREDRIRCHELQSRIVRTRRLLERIEEGETDFFSYDVHFAHVMAAGGFDVIAGNPPWVRNSRIDPDARKMYRERYRLFGRSKDASAFHQPDLSIAFLEKSLDLAAPGGVVSMLLPAKILNAGYAAPLRAFLERETTVTDLIDWSDERKKHFRADTFPLGLIVKRRPGERRHEVEVTAGGSSFRVAQHSLRIGRGVSEWSLLPADVACILRRLAERFAPLDETLARRPIMGVKTGDNGSFFLEASSIECGWLNTADDIAIPTEFVCRCVRGRDVRRWTTAGSTWMLWPPRNGFETPPQWLQELALKRGVEPGAFRLKFIRPKHVGIKVAWKDVSRGMSAAVLPDVVNVAGHSFPLVPNQTLYSLDAVSFDEAYAIAALLNSDIAGALLLAHAERAKDDYYRYFGRTVARMPFPPIAEGEPPWEELVRASRAAHRNAREADASSIDKVVADLFEVTRHELEVLRAHLARRLGAR